MGWYNGQTIPSVMGVGGDGGPLLCQEARSAFHFLLNVYSADTQVFALAPEMATGGMFTRFLYEDCACFGFDCLCACPCCLLLLIHALVSFLLYNGIIVSRAT